MRLVLFWVVALHALGCTFSDQPPVRADVRCTNSDDCPLGHVCDLSGQCSSETHPVRGVNLTPTLATAGQELSLEFVADFQQKVPAWVRAVHDGEVLPFEAKGSGFRLTVPGTAAQGKWAVLADLEDTGSRVYLRVPLGEFELDFDAPRVTSAHIAYLPTVDNALVRAGLKELVHSASQGTTVNVVVETSEPTLGPALRATINGASVAFTRQAPFSSTHHVFALSSRHPEEGAWPLTFEGADEAGNHVATTLGLTLDNDTTPPAAPPVNVEGAIVLRRESEGGPDAGRRMRFTVEAMTEQVAFEGALLVIVNGAVAATTPVKPDAGVVNVEFFPSRDEETVEVQAIDLAGNASPPVEVRDIRWVAWLGPDATPTTPHRVFPRMAQDPALRLPSEAGGGLTSSWPVQVEGGVRWNGPETSLGYSSTMWTDLEGAVISGPANAARERLTNAQCRTRGRGFQPTLVVIDNACVDLGEFGTTTRGDRFFFDSAVFDLLRREVLVQGGGAFGKVVELNPDGVPVVEVLDAGAVPFDVDSRMVYDFQRDEVVLVGNRPSNDGGARRETWVYRDEWQPRSGPAMPPRLTGVMASDSWRGGAWFAGGYEGGTYKAFNDLWRWDGESWTQTRDGGVVLSNLVVHPASGEFFGYGSTGLVRFDGGTFSPIRGTSPFTGQSPAAATRWAWDPMSHKAVGVGTQASNAQGNVLTWVLDDRQVTQLLNLTPNGLAGLPLAPGPLGSVVGFTPTEGWRFRLDAGWSMFAADAGPAFRPVGVAASPDGGLWVADSERVYTLRSSGWDEVHRVPDGGTVRALAFFDDVYLLSSDANKGARVTRLTAGGAETRWQQSNFEPAAFSVGNSSVAVLGSPIIERTGSRVRDGVALVTIQDAGVFFDRVALVTPTELPLEAGALHVDEEDQLVANSTSGLRWLPRESRSPPAVVGRVSTSGLTIPRTASLRSVRFSALAGADSLGPAGSAPGLDGAQWLDGRWLTANPVAGPHQGSVAAPTLIEWVETNPDRLRRILRPHQTLGFALVGKRTSVTTRASLSVEWMSVEVTFRRAP